MTLRSRALFSCILLSGLAGCSTTTVSKQSLAELGKVEPPKLGWRLPKTVLDVTVTWVPTGCTDTATGPVIGAKVTAEAVPRAVPDPDIGPDFPNGLVQIDTRQLKSFWTDAAINYTVYPDTGGLLKGMGSHPVSQTGAIIGNVLTGVGKIAGILAGTQVIGPAKCGTVKATLAEIDRIKKRMAGSTKAKAEDDAQRLVSLRESITITETRTVDTAEMVDTKDANGRTVRALNRPVRFTDGFVTVFEPAAAKMVSSGWTNVGAADERYRVALFLDLKAANLLNPRSCDDGSASCSTPSDLNTTVVSKSALFRQAAYIPVLFRKAEISGSTVVTDADGVVYEKKPLAPAKIVAFGQFGQAKTLPLTVAAFRDTNWVLEFSQFGEITSASYANKAQGVGVSSAFSGAATAASDLNGLEAKAAGTLDTGTLRLQTENAKLKAQADNFELKAKIELQNAGKKDDE